ncbi:hypothetical protein [Geobacter sp. SVR]|uniref:hypothetical protein n=1 Tax=Geobacter sp. SVR TaxID=2495594 RepID=UPI00143EFA2A|nr:hypothetical protein [Geobacter sp. SVR]BCS52315.1 hypothetical protein GSVR_06230 [Geobacter sp. SVR]GCF85026.1 hypothetical protein GSbR_16260 [Geobacter sp. SVR]
MKINILIAIVFACTVSVSSAQDNTSVDLAIREFRLGLPKSEICEIGAKYIRTGACEFHVKVKGEWLKISPIFDKNTSTMTALLATFDKKYSFLPLYKGLIEKYGETENCKVNDYENAFGAKFKGAECIWYINGGSIFIKEPVGTKGGYIEMHSKEYNDEIKQRKKETDKNPGF